MSGSRNQRTLSSAHHRRATTVGRLGRTGSMLYPSGGLRLEALEQRRLLATDLSFGSPGLVEDASSGHLQVNYSISGDLAGFAVKLIGKDDDAIDHVLLTQNVAAPGSTGSHSILITGSMSDWQGDYTLRAELAITGDPTPANNSAAIVDKVFIDGSGLIIAQGTSGVDTLATEINGGDLDVTLNSVVRTLDYASVTGLHIRGREGDDVIEPGTDLQAAIWSWGGAGADTLQGGASDNYLNGGKGEDSLWLYGGLDSGATNSLVGGSEGMIDGGEGEMDPAPDQSDLFRIYQPESAEYLPAVTVTGGGADTLMVYTSSVAGQEVSLSNTASTTEIVLGSATTITAAGIVGVTATGVGNNTTFTIAEHPQTHIDYGIVGGGGASNVLVFEDAWGLSSVTAEISSTLVQYRQGTTTYLNVQGITLSTGSANDTVRVTQPAIGSLPSIAIDVGGNTADVVQLTLNSTGQDIDIDDHTVAFGAGSIIDYQNAETVRIYATTTGDSNYTVTKPTSTSTLPALITLTANSQATNTLAVDYGAATNSLTPTISPKVLTGIDGTTINFVASSLALTTGSGADAIGVVESSENLPALSIDSGTGADTLAVTIAKSATATLYPDQLTFTSSPTVTFLGVEDVSLDSTSQATSQLKVISTGADSLPNVSVSGNAYDTLAIQSTDQISGAYSATSGSTSFAADSASNNVTSEGIAWFNLNTIEAYLTGVVLGQYYEVYAPGWFEVAGTVTVPTGFAPGTEFRLIRTFGTIIDGTFSGLPEGATLSIGSRDYEITYEANGYSDIAFTDVDPRPIESYVHSDWILYKDADNNHVLSTGDVVTNTTNLSDPARVVVSYGESNKQGASFTESFGIVTSLDSGSPYIDVPNFTGTFPASLSGSETIQDAIDATDTFGMIKILNAASYAGNVDVNKHVSMVGEVTIGGSLTVSDASAKLTTGDGPGTVTVAGDLTLAPTVRFSIKLDTTSDKYVVNGASSVIDLGGAILELAASVAPAGRYTIIENNSANAVTGTFAGLAEGAVLTIGRHTYRITYQGGTGGNDVVLSTSSVVGRQVFYDDSVWDGNAPGAGASDDAAIATDKAALTVYMHGAVGKWNYTNYEKGINGLMIDLAKAGSGISANDFVFKVGNNNSPGTWAAAPAPTAVTVRPGAGVDGSDRVEIIWSAGAIKNTWLEVTLLANANTWLGSADTFYFGNLSGDGIRDSAAMVTDSADINGVASNSTTNAAIDNNWDFNRDGQVNSADATVATNNSGASLVAINAFTNPIIGTFDVPSAGNPGSPLTLMASNITDPNHLLSGVDFYTDVNQNGILDGPDTLLAQGTAVPGSNGAVYTATIVPSTGPGALNVLVKGITTGGTAVRVPPGKIVRIGHPTSGGGGGGGGGAPVGFFAALAVLPVNATTTSAGAINGPNNTGPGVLTNQVNAQVGNGFAISYAVDGGIGTAIDPWGNIGTGAGLTAALAYSSTLGPGNTIGLFSVSSTAAIATAMDNTVYPFVGLGAGVGLGSTAVAGGGNNTYLIAGTDGSGNPLPVGTPMTIQGFAFALATVQANSMFSGTAFSTVPGSAILVWLGGQQIASNWAGATAFSPSENLTVVVATNFVATAQVGQVLTIGGGTGGVWTNDTSGGSIGMGMGTAASAVDLIVTF